MVHQREFQLQTNADHLKLLFAFCRSGSPLNYLSYQYQYYFDAAQNQSIIPYSAKSFRDINETHREKRLVFYSIQYRNGWLAASDLFHRFTQSIKFYTFHYQYRCSKNVIHQIDSKNGWLLLSAASFTEKFGLGFVLTLEKPFSWGFNFQANRKSIASSKK